MAKTEIDSNLIKQKLDFTNNSIQWQYIEFDNDYAIGVSSIFNSAPLVSGAISAKEPCFNYNEYRVSGERNYFFEIDRSIYSGECVTDSRYSKINAPSTKEYKLFQENLNFYKNESIYE